MGLDEDNEMRMTIREMDISDPNPEVNYRYEGTHSGKPCLGSITVKMVGPYLVTMLYEAATRDNKDLLVDIDYSLKLLD